jgi:hypothetical protein
MPWSVIRKATEEDKARLRAASARFAQRHGLGDLPDDVIDLYQAGVVGPAPRGCSLEEEQRARYLLPLWKRAMRRALRHPSADGIAYGCVGWDTP